MYQLHYSAAGATRPGGKQYRHYGTAVGLAQGAIATGHYATVVVVHAPTGRTVFACHRRPQPGQGWLSPLQAAAVFGAA